MDSRKGSRDCFNKAAAFSERQETGKNSNRGEKYCRRCGKRLTVNAKYCRFCGAATAAYPDNGGQKLEKSRKGKRGKRILAVVVPATVLALCAVLFLGRRLFQTREPSVRFDYTAEAAEAGLTQKDAENFVDVIGQLDTIYDEYTDESGYVPEESVQEALDALEEYAGELQAEGLVLDYSRSDQYLYLEFQKDITYVRTIPEEGAMGSPEDLEVSFMFPFDGTDPYFNILDQDMIDSMEEWGGCQITSLWDQDVSVEALAEDAESDLYIWYGHGNYSERTSSYLYTGEKITPENLLAYMMLWSQGYLQMVDGYYAVTPKFVSAYFPEMDGGLVILNACSGGKDGALASAFQEKGADAVLAYDGTVNCWYSSVLTWSLLKYMNGQGEDGICHTLSEALALAQEDVGSSCNQPLFAELFLGWMLGDRNIYEVVLGQYENFALSQHQCGTQAVIYSEAAEDYTLWPGLAGTLVSEDRSSEEDLLAVLTDPDGRTIGSATVKNGDSFRFDRLEEGGGPCTLTVSAVSDGEVLGTFENISIEEHRRMELGELKLEQQTSDIAAIGDSRVVKISMGYAHSAAITENGDLYLWGENRFGCLGTGDSEDRELPVKIMSGVKDVSLGLYFSGAVTESGDLYMWGYNDVGQLGTEEISTKEYSPAPVKIMEHVNDVELGASKAAAITEDGELYVWGSSSCGYTVDGEAEGSRTPVKIMDNVKMVSLGKNTEFGAALTEDGSLYTWGKWSGNGSIMPKYPAEKIMDHVKTVCMGYDTAAAVTESGELYIWGESWHGALGNGDTQHTYTTSPVKIMDQVKEVSLGNDHGAALTEDGTLYTWGNNGAGNLGNGVTGTCATPVEAMENVAQISLGGGHFAAITEDGELYTWGQSNKDQLGREGGTGQNKVVLGE